MIIIKKRLKLEEPSDVRNLIKKWLRDVAETGKLPFEGRIGGVLVQMLNMWLKAYETEKLEDVERRIEQLERERSR